MVRSGKLNPTSARARIKFLKGLFDFAIRRRWAHFNPAPVALRELRAPQAPKVRTFRVDDIRQVLAAASTWRKGARFDSHAQLECVVNLAAFCGLRWGEIFGLTLPFVDLENGWIRVRHSLDGFGNLQSPKTKAGNRDVFLPDHLRAMLASYINRFPPTNERLLVFTAHGAQHHVRAASFHRAHWRPLLRRAGLGDEADPIHFHALRHFAASWMIENGWALPDVAQALGHANVNITLQVYAHVIKSRTQSADAVRLAATKLLAHPESSPACA